MSQLTIFIKTRCQPGKRDEVFKLWEKHLKPRLMSNPDQIGYSFSYDNYDENVFHLFELYASQEAFQANSQESWFADYMAEAGPLLDGEPEFSMSTPQFTKGM